MDAPVLAVDTTAESGSIALVGRETILEEVPLDSPDGFAHIIYDRIGALLGRHKLRIEDLECFAAAAGPGSFIGVRIGLTVVKGLAEMSGKRVAAVSNLQALACFGSAELRATVVDARRGEVYGALYDRNLELRAPEVVMRFQDWFGTLPDEPLELISMDPAPFARLIGSMPVVTAPRALAGAIGRIAWKRLAAGETSDPAGVDANYVRRSDAELFWRDPP